MLKEEVSKFHDKDSFQTDKGSETGWGGGIKNLKEKIIKMYYEGTLQAL